MLTDEWLFSPGEFRDEAVRLLKLFLIWWPSAERGWSEAGLATNPSVSLWRCGFTGQRVSVADAFSHGVLCEDAFDQTQLFPFR